MARSDNFLDSVCKYRTLLIITGIVVAILIIAISSLLIFNAQNSEQFSELSGIVFIGGIDRNRIAEEDAHHTTLEFYHPTSPNTCWSSRFSNVSLLRERISHVAAVLGNKVIYGGGVKIHLLGAQKSTEILDLITLTVTPGPSLLEARTDSGAAVFNNIFVICGGKGRDGRSLASCEQLIGDHWQPFTALPEPRNALQMVNLEGKLYSLGGLMRWETVYYTLAANLHQWDPESKKWGRKADMMTGRAFFAATAFKKSIVACGSHLKQSPYTLDTCEQYDVITNRWEYIASMNERRDELSMIVFEGGLYVLGGGVSIDGFVEYESYASVERYVNGNWSFVTDMKYNNSGFAAVVVGNN